MLQKHCNALTKKKQDNMEREELLQEVQSVIEADGKQLSRSISEETINAELDDELENIGDDEEANKAVYSRIAKRLLRIDGNIHSNVSREVKEYKAKAAKPPKSGEKTPKNGEGTEDDEEMPKWAKAITDRLDTIEKSRNDRAAAEAKNAAVDAVKKGLREVFKKANIEVNEYIYRQTLRDLEIPEQEEGTSVDTDALIKKMERSYYKNLKEAGLDKKETAKPHSGAKNQGGNASSLLDDKFKKKGLREGWGKKD